MEGFLGITLVSAEFEQGSLKSVPLPIGDCLQKQDEQVFAKCGRKNPALTVQVPTQEYAIRVLGP